MSANQVRSGAPGSNSRPTRSGAGVAAGSGRVRPRRRRRWQPTSPAVRSAGRPACGPPAPRGRRGARRGPVGRRRCHARPGGSGGSAPAVAGRPVLARRASLEPGGEASAGDAKDPAQQADRVGGLLRHDEPIPAHRVVSFAKKAAAFFRISRSWRRVWFSRGRRPSSSRSAVVSSPGRPRPASTSAWWTQCAGSARKPRGPWPAQGWSCRRCGPAPQPQRGTLPDRAVWYVARELLRGLAALKRPCVHQNGATPVVHQ
jgi:hypothetical protein